MNGANSDMPSHENSNVEMQLSNILDNMLEGLQIIGYDWKYIYVNDALVKQSHYTKDKLMGNSIKELYPGVETTEVFQVLQDVMVNRKSRSIETEFEFPDKSKSWFELSVQPVNVGISILSIDISARRLAERKLIESEQRYRSLIEQATDGIFVSDQQGKYVEVNHQACEMLGYTKDELLTMTVFDVLPGNEASRKPPRFDILLSGKRLLSSRRFKRKDGTIIFVELSSKMLENGTMLAIARDISKRKKAEAKIKSAERKFRNLTQTAFDAIVLMDQSGAIAFWNRGAELIFGYTKDEVLHQPLTMIMPEDYRAAHENGLENYLATGTKHVIDRVIELTGRKKSGETFPIEISITSWDDNNQKVFSGIIRDISERKEASLKIEKMNERLEHRVAERTAQLEDKVQLLKESEEKFQKAFQGSSAGISITELTEGRFIDMNNAFTRLTGFSREEALGRNSLELGMTDNGLKNQVIAKLSEQGFLRDLEVTIKTKSGLSLEMLSSIELIIIGGQKYALTIGYDITERKKIHLQLAQANKELEAFSYSVSHDLRAPLRSVIGYTQALEEDFGDTLNEKAKQTISTIIASGKRMNNLVEALLNFARLGQREVDKQIVVTKNIVSHWLTTIRHSFPNTTVEIYDLADMHADPQLIGQVWHNLLSNAFKYSGKQPSPRVEVGSHSDAREVVFFVRDNGVGFSMDYAHKLFNVFQRLHSISEFEGIGIGLSIVKRIIEKHGGRVWAESANGAGATFYFAIPTPTP